MSREGEPRIKREQISGSVIHSRSCIEEQGQQAYRRAEGETPFRVQVWNIWHILPYNAEVVRKSMFGSVGYRGWVASRWREPVICEGRITLKSTVGCCPIKSKVGWEVGGALRPP